MGEIIHTTEFGGLKGGDLGSLGEQGGYNGKWHHVKFKCTETLINSIVNHRTSIKRKCLQNVKLRNWQKLFRGITLEKCLQGPSVGP